MILLLVEDSQTQRAATADLLRLRGFTVRECHTPAEALPELERKRPMVLLLDYIMPGMDGGEVLQEMKRRGITRVPVIVTTALPDPLPPMALPYRLLRKPFTVDELEAAILEVITPGSGCQGRQAAVRGPEKGG